MQDRLLARRSRPTRAQAAPRAGVCKPQHQRCGGHYDRGGAGDGQVGGCGRPALQRVLQVVLQLPHLQVRRARTARCSARRPGRHCCEQHAQLLGQLAQSALAPALPGAWHPATVLETCVCGPRIRPARPASLHLRAPAERGAGAAGAQDAGGVWRAAAARAGGGAGADGAAGAPGADVGGRHRALPGRGRADRGGAPARPGRRAGGRHLRRRQHAKRRAAPPVLEAARPGRGPLWVLSDTWLAAERGAGRRARRPEQAAARPAVVQPAVAPSRRLRS